MNFGENYCPEKAIFVRPTMHNFISIKNPNTFSSIVLKTPLNSLLTFGLKEDELFKASIIA